MKIYFAGAIRAGRNDQEVYQQLILLLTKYGTVLTEHIGDKNLSLNGEALSEPEIFDRDLNWLTEADVVVAEVTSPSLGVGYELGKFDGQKPILCLYRPDPERKLSAMIKGNNNFTVKEYHNLEEAESILTNFFQSLK